MTDLLGPGGHVLRSAQSVFLTHNHLFLRDPHAGVEDVAAMVDAGYHLILCNIGDFAPSQWQVIRDRAEREGVCAAPWLRTHAPDGSFSPDKLDVLIACADDWGTPLCVNSESELKGTGSEATKLIADRVGDRDAAISMEAWPYDKVDWYLLGHLPMMPQISPILGGPATDPLACRQQWNAYGCPCVVLTYGTFGGQGPELYDLLTPYGLYTADDCGGNYAAWAPEGSADPCAGSTPVPPEPTPPPPNGGDVTDNTIPAPAIGEKIGSNHGITALVDYLQKQPGMPTRGADYDPTKPKTWPWPERVERTLRILAQDHDASTTGYAVEDPFGERRADE
jgi:hypothetical protein